ncbi:MAG: cell wall-binding repeat-containing protein, partial [Firmicutes bacterium]|nr:cell wall-binding repeat-containing protein [Bacillota bacterium]
MRKRLLAVILSVFMIGAVFPAAAHAGDVEINEITFPDENFRNFVKKYYGAGGILTEAQIAEVTQMDVSNQNISDLRGIEYFTNLEELYCSSNQLTSLNVSGCTGLEELYCSSNQLTTLDVSKCTGLEY